MRVTAEDGCRCDDCKSANSAYMREWRKKAATSVGANFNHGTVGGYTNYKCRCLDCAAAAASYHKGWREARRLVTP